MSFITSLSYLVVGASNVDDWTAYGTAQVGLQVSERSQSGAAFRMDAREQRIVVRPSTHPGIEVFGWETADRAHLDALAARLEEQRIQVTRGSSALAHERRVQELICFRDPLGYCLEVSHGGATAASDFVPGRAVSGFRTGELGLGHVVLTVEHIEQALVFYRDVLGFRLSDYYHHPFSGYFFHVNQRHHSFALIETGSDGVHHVMLEHFDLDDVGQGYDLAGQQEGRIAVTLGRHCGDYVTSFYTRTPSNFMIEHGWGGRLIDPATWVPDIRTEGPSLWGHDRSWLPADARSNALKLRLKNAEAGIRRPVQVLDGHHLVMPR